MFTIPTWLLGVFAGWRRVDVIRLAMAAVVAMALIAAWFTVARLVDGAVAEWQAAQEKAKTDLVERMAAGAARDRQRYEQDKGRAVQRAAELEQELAKYLNGGDPIAFPEAVARRLNQ